MKISPGLVIMGVTVLFIGSCNKGSKIHGESEVPVESISSLAGSWELRQTVGNMGTINYSPGNGSVVVFTDSSYSTASPQDKIFIQGIAASRGTCKIVADSTVNTCTGWNLSPGQFAYRLLFNDDETADKLFFQIEGDKLIVISGYFPTDGGLEKTYQKQ